MAATPRKRYATRHPVHGDYGASNGVHLSCILTATRNDTAPHGDKSVGVLWDLSSGNDIDYQRAAEIEKCWARVVNITTQTVEVLPSVRQSRS